MVITYVHFCFYIIADLINQIYFQKRFTSDEVPNNAFVLKIIFVIEDVINCFLRDIPCHSLFAILADKIAVFTC